MNYTQIMRQAQEMQKKLLKQQEAHAQQEFEGQSGSGLVKVKVKGSGEVLSVALDASVVDAQEIEMLQDLIVVALNEAHKKLNEQAAQGGDLAGMAQKMGIKLPGF